MAAEERTAVCPVCEGELELRERGGYRYSRMEHLARHAVEHTTGYGAGDRAMSEWLGEACWIHLEDAIDVCEDDTWEAAARWAEFEIDMILESFWRHLPVRQSPHAYWAAVRWLKDEAPALFFESQAAPGRPGWYRTREDWHPGEGVLLQDYRSMLCRLPVRIYCEACDDYVEAELGNVRNEEEAPCGHAFSVFSREGRDHSVDQIVDEMAARLAGLLSEASIVRDESEDEW